MSRKPLHVPAWTGNEPYVLDLFCGAGGASKGYADLGFRPIGVDLDPLMLKRYPYESIQADAMMILSLLQSDILARHCGWWNGMAASDFAFIHASPPCEGYSKTRRIGNSDAERLIEGVRGLLYTLGRPWVIENVPEAAESMWNPTMLCGAMFPELRVYRHRLFETSFPVRQPHHNAHHAHQPKMGRPVKDGDYIQVVGHFSNADYARRAMGISWMGRDQLKEAIPPTYTHYIGQFVP